MGWWWLRAPGNISIGAACVRPGGGVNDNGNNVNNDNVAVRPDSPHKPEAHPGRDSLCAR